MVSKSLLNFVSEVVRSHELATGLKPLTSHQQIIDYAQSQGFIFSSSDWAEYYQSDFSALATSEQDLIYKADPNHWSWAFRQISKWRAILMEGAGNGSA